MYHESTFLSKHQDLANKTKHSTALEAGKIAVKARVNKLILGHFSSRYKNLDELKIEATSLFFKYIYCRGRENIYFLNINFTTMKDLSDFRISYEKYNLSENSISEDPLSLFKNWFDEICDSKQVKEPNAMTLSTVDSQNTPTNRVVLLKKFSEKGFVFYTNYDSRKGKVLLITPMFVSHFFGHHMKDK